MDPTRRQLTKQGTEKILYLSKINKKNIRAKTEKLDEVSWFNKLNKKRLKDY